LGNYAEHIKQAKNNMDFLSKVNASINNNWDWQVTVSFYVAIGYLVSLLSLFIIFPILGIESSTGKNLIITLYFTVISIARSYILRRYFNKKQTK